MPNLTLSITDELQKKMKEHRDIRWSEVVRESIARRIQELELIEEIAQESTLTPQDVRRIAKKVDKAAATRLGYYENSD